MINDLVHFEEGKMNLSFKKREREIEGREESHLLFFFSVKILYRSANDKQINHGWSFTPMASDETN